MLQGAQALGMNGYMIQYYTFYPMSFTDNHNFPLEILDEVKPFIESLLQ